MTLDMAFKSVLTTQSLVTAVKSALETHLLITWKRVFADDSNKSNESSV
jgi:hypothetical protein